MKKTRLMPNKVKLHAMVSILTLGLFLFTAAAPAMSKMQSLPGREPEQLAPGEVRSRVLTAREKSLRIEKAPAGNNAVNPLPAVLMLADKEMGGIAVAAPAMSKMQSRAVRGELERLSPGEVRSIVLMTTLENDYNQWKPKLLAGKNGANPFPAMLILADQDIGGIAAGGFSLRSGQGTVMDQSVEFWVQTGTQLYKDIQEKPPTPWYTTIPEDKVPTPWLDVAPYTWFLIDHAKIPNRYYKWWEWEYRDYGKKYYGDVKFDVSGTYFSRIHEFKNPDEQTLSYEAYVLEMRFYPDGYQYGGDKYGGVKRSSQGAMIYSHTVISCEARRGYFLFFE